MKLSLLFLALLMGCQDYNSNTADKTKYGPTDLEANPDFRAAYAIIQTRCITCHDSSIHNVWSTYNTSQKWIDAGMVVPGNSTASLVVRRIINSGQNDSNMPIGSGALPNDEYDAIKAWIDGLP